jgi:hypothetical protein
LIVAARAAAALLWSTRRPALAGAAAAAGVLLKVWPVVVLLGLRRRTLWRMSAVAAGAGLTASVGLTALGPGAWSFLEFQSKRGLQIESAAATTLLIARLVNGGWTIVHRYGAGELSGPAVSAAARGCVAATVVGGAILLFTWRMRPRAADLALAAVLLALVTSRVLSPQYLVWAVAVAAVCALDSRTTQRPVVMLVLATALLSQVEFPFVYDRVATGSRPGVVVLALRNGLLLCATVWSVVRLRGARCRSASRRGRRQSSATRPAAASIAAASWSSRTSPPCVVTIGVYGSSTNSSPSNSRSTASPQNGT